MTRRQWLQRAGQLAAGFGLASWMRGWARGGSGAGFSPALQKTSTVTSPFKLSVITDEIGQDFEHTLQIASREFGLEYVEIRTLWNKNVVKLDAKELGEARQLLDKYALKATDIASPMFKVDWPGAPKSKYAPAEAYGDAGFTYAQQDEVLERTRTRAISARDRIGLLGVPFRQRCLRSTARRDRA